MKYVTFSFDDGVTQDKRLVELLDKYGLKATFNLNSSLLGLKGGWEFDGKMCDPDHGIDVTVDFEDLPDDFECPLCGVGKDNFSAE